MMVRLKTWTYTYLYIFLKEYVQICLVYIKSSHTRYFIIFIEISLFIYNSFTDIAVRLEAHNFVM